MRNTRQRKVILEELKNTTAHPTASELHERVKQHLPRISLGTVYRNLEQLVSAGKAHRIETGGGQARYDADPRQHYHIRCVDCGKVEDAIEVPPDFLEIQWQQLGGQEVVGHRLEFLGRCKRCGRKEQ